MKVWIDQDLCTGDGLCEEIAPTVFTLLDDGLAYVKDGDKVLSDPGGAEGIAPVPAGQEGRLLAVPSTTNRRTGRPPWPPAACCRVLTPARGLSRSH
jgi:ferredoxin